MGQSQEIFLRLINAESGNQPLLGRALVARAILNRHWLIAQGVVPPSKFNSKSADILDIVSAPRQFQPYDEGKLNQPLSAEQRNKAMLAVSLALDADKLKKVIINDLQVDETEANKMLAVTGFSTHDAIPDSSQTANTFGLSGHKFTTAGNDNTLVLNSKGVIPTPESQNAIPENVLSTSNNQENMAVNEKKAIDGLNSLAPILDVKLNDQGETVRERYLKKIYGDENVSVKDETKEFIIKGGGNSLVPAPKPTWQGQLGAMGLDVALVQLAKL
jgi:hypothetical protein